jgi:hypothetical protein
MKKIFFYTLLIALSACETEKITFRGPYHVRFTLGSVTERESNGKIVPLEIHLAGPALESDVTVSYTMAGSAREGVDFSIVGTRGKVVIKKGKYKANIELRLINNANNILRSQELIFTLTSVTSSEVTVGQGEGGIGRKLTLTILDDCILSGTYDGTRTALSIPTKNLVITSSDCETYFLSNWNVDIFDYPLDLGLKFTDKGDNTLIIPSQEQEEFPDALATITGSGSVNPLTKEIFLTIKFIDFKPPFDVTITLKPEAQ